MPQLRAEALIEAAEPAALFAHLRARIEVHGLKPVGDGAELVYLADGMEVRLARNGAQVILRLAAPDSAHLAWLRERAEGYVTEFSEADALGAAWRGDLEKPLPARLTLLRRAEILPGLHRFTFHTDKTLKGSGPHLRLRPEGVKTPRCYTIRAIRGDELDIDVVMHGAGALAGWAVGAQPEAILEATGPGGALAPPAARLLIGGDSSALPAMALILDENPAARGLCIYAAPEEAAGYLRPPSGITMLRAADEAELAELMGAAAQIPLEANLSQPDISLWFAGEAETAHYLRKIFSRNTKLPPARRRSAAYWRRGA